MRFLFRFGYFGDRYFGVTRQPGLPTIESVLLDAFGRYLLDRRIVFSSRTDRGVHALSNVFSVNLERKPSVGEVNDSLDDVWVWAVSKSSINPRKSTEWRHYLYTFPERFGRGCIERMRECARFFTGRRDFRAFSIPEVSNTVREVFSIDIYNTRLTVMEIRARSFLRQMVRRIAYALYLVGKGEWGEEEILNAFREGKPVPPMPASGLVLVEARVGARFFIDGEWLDRMLREWRRRAYSARVVASSLSSATDIFRVNLNYFSG